jgi:hypothetical protein
MNPLPYNINPEFMNPKTYLKTVNWKCDSRAVQEA